MKTLARMLIVFFSLLIGSVFVSSQAGPASGVASLTAHDPPREVEEHISKDTARIAAVEQEGKFVLFIFSSKTGKVLPVGADLCIAATACGVFVKQHHDDNKMILVRMETPSTLPKGGLGRLLQGSTAGIIGIEMSGKLEKFVFVSTTGAIVPVEADACDAEAACRAFVQGYGVDGKTILVRLKSPQSKEQAPKGEQPQEQVAIQGVNAVTIENGVLIHHRDLREVDIQNNNRPRDTAHDCAAFGGIPNYDPENGFYLNCFSGSKGEEESLF